MQFDPVFDEYHQIYEEILTLCYPSKGKTGFTERNLTCNFVFAYKKANPKDSIFHWFEFQFGQNNNSHLDGIIVNYKQKEIILIEGKRYCAKKKVQDVFKDIERINNIFKERNGEMRLPKDASFTWYGLILADVWAFHTRPKMDIYKGYKAQTWFQNRIAGDYYTHDFKNGCTDEIIKSYKLLSFIWKL